MANEQASSARQRRGFSRASVLLQKRIGEAGKARGFAVSRLLTHWAEIVGEDIARVTCPVKIGYGRNGLGAKLTIMATGAQAPLLQMQTETIRDRVNSCYGYTAISAVRITQTGSGGFFEPKAEFNRNRHSSLPEPGPKAQQLASDVTDDRLRKALEQLGQNVISKNSS